MKSELWGFGSPELSTKPISIIFGVLERWKVEVFPNIFLVLLYTTKKLQKVPILPVPLFRPFKSDRLPVSDSEALPLIRVIET